MYKWGEYAIDYRSDLRMACLACSIKLLNNGESMCSECENKKIRAECYSLLIKLLESKHGDRLLPRAKEYNIKKLQECTKLDPESSDYLSQLGQSLLRAGRDVEAMDRMKMAYELNKFKNPKNKTDMRRAILQCANTLKLYKIDPKGHLEYILLYKRTLEEGSAASQEVYLQLAALMLEVQTTCKDPDSIFSAVEMESLTMEKCLEKATQVDAMNTPEVWVRVGRILMQFPKENPQILVKIPNGLAKYNPMMCFEKAYDVSDETAADACYFMALLCSDKDMAATKLAMALHKDAEWLVPDGVIRNTDPDRIGYLSPIVRELENNRGKCWYQIAKLMPDPHLEQELAKVLPIPIAICTRSPHPLYLPCF